MSGNPLVPSTLLRSPLTRKLLLPAIVAAGVLATAGVAVADPAAETAPTQEIAQETAPAPPEAPVQPAAPEPAVPAPASAAPPVSMKARMLTFTLKSPETLDMRGVEPSLYRGKFFRASVEDKRQCVAKRESEGHYDVVSHDGYHGAYQMSPALAKGATWMMLKEHKALLGEEVAKRVLAELRRTPLSEWPRYWQDAAFSTVYNWEHTGSGAKHWRGGRWHC